MFVFTVITVYTCTKKCKGHLDVMGEDRCLNTLRIARMYKAKQMKLEKRASTSNPWRQAEESEKNEKELTDRWIKGNRRKTEEEKEQQEVCTLQVPSNSSPNISGRKVNRGGSRVACPISGVTPWAQGNPISPAKQVVAKVQSTACSFTREN
jgi:hypothetical protein